MQHLERDMPMGRVAHAARRRRIWVDLLLYPGHTLPTAAAPVLVAIGLALHEGLFAAGPALAAFFASWCIHVGGVFTDNLMLITRHSSVREHPELLDALEDGTLTTRGLRAAIVTCFGASVLAAPYLAGVVGWPTVLVLGAIGCAAAIAYSAGPLPYAQLGVADPVFFAMFAFAAVPGAFAVQAAAHWTLTSRSFADVWRLIPGQAFVLGVPVGALVTNVLLIDEIRDVDWDRAKGWHSGAVRFGRDWSQVELSALTAIAYALPFWFWRGLHYGPLVLLPFLTLPAAVGLAARVARAKTFDELVPMTPKASALALEFAALLGLGLAMS